jgi:hypothetical protein
MSNVSQSNRDEQSGQPANVLAANTAMQSKHSKWADSWFAGSASCPMCSGDDLQIVDANTDDSTRIEVWECASKDCAMRWQVELRESAIGLYQDADAVDSDWYERDENPPAFESVAKDGRARATILAALRYWQREGLISAGREQDIATDSGRLPPLTAEEIEVLCAQIGSSDGARLRC